MPTARTTVNVIKKSAGPTAWLFCILFATIGTACSLVDLNDHWSVPPTAPPPGLEVEVPAEPESINDAWRSLEDFRTSANTYIERRNEDILDEAKKTATIKGAASAGLAALHETIGQVAGPWAPLLMLIAGRAMKRRGDKTPEEHQAELDRYYDMGVAEGQKYIEAVKHIVKDEPAV